MNKSETSVQLARRNTMSILVYDCPRCRSKSMTFDVRADIPTRIEYNWQRWFEAFCVCRHCLRSTIFSLSQKEYSEKDFWGKNAPSSVQNALNLHFKVEGFICLKDMGAAATPEHVPEPIATAFHEGAVSVIVGNWNAAGTMFRLVIDLATKPILPPDDADGLNKQVRRNLGLRLPWLFDHGRLPNDLRDLSSCVHQDGNDGAHAGTLSQHDAQDLLDFATALLERIYTEPERLRLAKERREQRRTARATGGA
jgi:hypothetical protein